MIKVRERLQGQVSTVRNEMTECHMMEGRKNRQVTELQISKDQERVLGKHHYLHPCSSPLPWVPTSSWWWKQATGVGGPLVWSFLFLK